MHWYKKKQQHPVPHLVWKWCERYLFWTCIHQEGTIRPRRGSTYSHCNFLFSDYPGKFLWTLVIKKGLNLFKFFPITKVFIALARRIYGHPGWYSGWSSWLELRRPGFRCTFCHRTHWKILGQSQPALCCLYWSCSQTHNCHLLWYSFFISEWEWMLLKTCAAKLCILHPKKIPLGLCTWQGILGNSFLLIKDDVDWPSLCPWTLCSAW